jgi:hypothetical protein
MGGNKSNAEAGPRIGFLMELVELLFECSQLPLELRNLLVP